MADLTAMEALLEGDAWQQITDFSIQKILMQYLVTERRRLQLLLQEASATNEEWRAGVDRQGQEIIRLTAEHDRLVAEVRHWKEAHNLGDLD